MADDNNLKTNNNGIKPQNDDEEEETYMYDVRRPMAFINEGANGIFDIKKQTGLNTAGSVFDKNTIFHSDK